MGLYHLAWEVETLDDLEGLASELSVRGALVGASDHGSTKALYARDPDDLEFECRGWCAPPSSTTRRWRPSRASAPRGRRFMSR